MSANAALRWIKHEETSICIYRKSPVNWHNKQPVLAGVTREGAMDTRSKTTRGTTKREGTGDTEFAAQLFALLDERIMGSELVVAYREYFLKYTQSKMTKSQARKLLQEWGIYDKDGNLCPEYRS